MTRMITPIDVWRTGLALWCAGVRTQMIVTAHLMGARGAAARERETACGAGAAITALSRRAPNELRATSRPRAKVPCEIVRIDDHGRPRRLM